MSHGKSSRSGSSKQPSQKGNSGYGDESLPSRPFSLPPGYYDYYGIPRPKPAAESVQAKRPGLNQGPPIPRGLLEYYGIVPPATSDSSPGPMQQTSEPQAAPSSKTEPNALPTEAAVAPSSVDELSPGGHAGDEQHIDHTDGGSSDSAAPSTAATPPAVPINLVQTVTGWAPGATKYGFQLSFSCSSSSGNVADLQSQPTLRWREYVTYSRNDFAHRISPSNPTILPGGGGISFASPSATAASANSLIFNTARDTHWMPTSAVRPEDFTSTASPPRTLPAIMESAQLYQYSTDGSTWTTFAGPFTLRRTFAQTSAGHTFTTNKVGIHSVMENYKP